MTYTREQAQAALKWADGNEYYFDLDPAEVLAAMVLDLQRQLSGVSYVAEGHISQALISRTSEILHRTGYGEDE